MRINRFIATHTGLSRRKADELITSGRVIVNRKLAHPGLDVELTDSIIIDGKRLVAVKRVSLTILLHKPTGYVCSRDGQGSPTVYDLLPKSLSHLKVAGRLDKDSSGLVIMTSEGQLLQELTHPKFNKPKVYTVTLNKALTKSNVSALRRGVNIGDDRLSHIHVTPLSDKNLSYSSNEPVYEVTMTEGRNRQIRRTFEALGLNVVGLHRRSVGQYNLENIRPTEFVYL